MEAGLAIAEMIASLQQADCVFGFLAEVIPSEGRLLFQPIILYCSQWDDDHSSGPFKWMFIGVIQSYRNMERTQDRIIHAFWQDNSVPARNVLKS